MTQYRHIPESRIALNPVVIDDSKRGSLAPKPLDEHALITRLMEWEMEEHIAAKKHHGFTKGLEWEAREKAFHEMVEKIWRWKEE